MQWLKTTTNISSHSACGSETQEWLSWFRLSLKVAVSVHQGCGCLKAWLGLKVALPRLYSQEQRAGYGCWQDTSVPLLTGLFTKLLEYPQTWPLASPRVSELKRERYRDRDREPGWKSVHTYHIYLLEVSHWIFFTIKSENVFYILKERMLKNLQTYVKTSTKQRVIFFSKGLLFLIYRWSKWYNMPKRTKEVV